MGAITFRPTKVRRARNMPLFVHNIKERFPNTLYRCSPDLFAVHHACMPDNAHVAPSSVTELRRAVPADRIFVAADLPTYVIVMVRLPVDIIKSSSAVLRRGRFDVGPLRRGRHVEMVRKRPMESWMVADAAGGAAVRPVSY